MFTKIKKIQIDDVHATMLDSFDRYQETEKIISIDDGKVSIKEDRFIDEWSLERKREIAKHFQEVIEKGGAVITATNRNQLIGFAVIEAEDFGVYSNYRELSYLYVTKQERRKKVGKALFSKAKSIAKRLGAERLYISSHPSGETQAFFLKMGCVIAVEVNEEILKREPRDIQLEFKL